MRQKNGALAGIRRAAQGGEEPEREERRQPLTKKAAGASGGIHHREAVSFDTQKRETAVSGVFDGEKREAAQAA